MSGFITNQRLWGVTTFVDHVSDFIYVHLMIDLSLAETLLEKSSSNNTWYCGLTLPVFGFQTSATLPEWNGECLEYISIRKCGSHFDRPAPPALCKHAYNAYIGQKRV